MKFRAPFVLLTGLILAASAGFVLHQKWSKGNNKEHHVILISIDGFPAWLWNDESLQVPNLRKLAAEGASTKAMTVSNPSITWINHTTLVTGVEPRK
ncbi:MAG TPA: alkaline phosphatase family protein, partial [Prosthecobacter sp.]